MPLAVMWPVKVSLESVLGGASESVRGVVAALLGVLELCCYFSTPKNSLYLVLLLTFVSKFTFVFEMWH